MGEVALQPAGGRLLFFLVAMGTTGKSHALMLLAPDPFSLA